MVECASFTFFPFEHNPASETGFIDVVNQRMFKRNTIIQHKSFSTMQATFFRATKQVIVKLEPMADEYHLLVGLEENVEIQRWMRRRLLRRLILKKVVGEVAKGERRSRPPLSLTMSLG